MMKLPSHNEPIQNAWVVDDIEAAAMHWVNHLGVGPFFIAEYNSTILTNTYYRGVPSDVTMITALAYAGETQIELVQPLGEQPNIYRDTVPMGSTGFHHVCCWSTDLKADIQHYRDAGFEVASQGSVINGPGFAYIDTHQTLGCMIELMEVNEGLQGMFQMFKDAAKDWDGKEPLRKLG